MTLNGSLGNDSHKPRPARDPGDSRARPQLRRDVDGPVSREEAQQLYGLGTEAAANLKPNNNQVAAPRRLELVVGLMPLAPAAAVTAVPNRTSAGARRAV